jgi:hypothetical protein
MENPGNVGVTGGRRLLKSQNIDSRLLVDKIPGMWKLRVTLSLARIWELKKGHVRLEPLLAERWCILDPSLIIRRRIKDFAAGSGVGHCRIWRYDSFVSAG